jgi:low affinity Fe/Cu permease
MPRPATSWFDRLAKGAARWSGRPSAFLMALAVVLAWLVTGPIFKYSDTWQLVINTGTTVITFLMVFLIQNTQSRDTEAIQIKLDELIHVSEAASNALMDLEELDEDTLERYRAHYETLARDARALSRQLGGAAAGAPATPAAGERRSTGGEG